MECLTGFFALSKSCSSQVPKSGLYIDMLEGMNLKSISNIETGKFLTAQKFIDQKMILIGEKWKTDFADMLFGDMVESAMDSIISKNFCDDYNTGQAGTAGLKIEKIPTKLSSLFIPRFYFKSHTPANELPITVSDSTRSEVFYVTANADEEVAVEINWHSSQNTVSITFDDSTVGPSQQLIEPYTGAIAYFNHWFYNGCTGCTSKSSRYLKISGIDYNGNSISNYRGIRADVLLNCDREKMICLVAMEQKVVLLYMLGIEILNEWEAGDRFNFLAIHGKDWAKEKKIAWQESIDRSNFNNGKGIRNLLRKHEKECFICNSGKYVYSLP